MSTINEKSKEFWEQQLVELKTSGLSRAKYCRDKGINYERFNYWIKRLNPATPTFIRVKVPTESTCHQMTLCTLEVRGHILKIHDLSALSFLLEKLA